VKATGRDRLITFRRLGRTFDAYNRPVEGWTDLVQAWAEKADISDGERMQAAQIGATVTARFRTPYAPVYASIDAKDRIVLDGREYDIKGIKEIGTREGLEFTAAARADDA
jgi:SPP1 family predicted phage head-tail adaptor